MRRTHASLRNELEVDPKVVAEQLGHTLDLNLNTYAKVAQKRVPSKLCSSKARQSIASKSGRLASSFSADVRDGSAVNAREPVTEGGN